VKTSSLDVAVASQAPHTVSTLFDMDRQIIYAFVPYECVAVKVKARMGAEVCLSASCVNNGSSWHFHVFIEPAHFSISRRMLSLK
jgi:hypothetical protein